MCHNYIMVLIIAGKLYQYYRESGVTNWPQSSFISTNPSLFLALKLDSSKHRTINQRKSYITVRFTQASFATSLPSVPRNLEQADGMVGRVGEGLGLRAGNRQRPWQDQDAAGPAQGDWTNWTSSNPFLILGGEQDKGWQWKSWRDPSYSEVFMKEIV